MVSFAKLLKKTFSDTLRRHDSNTDINANSTVKPESPVSKKRIKRKNSKKKLNEKKEVQRSTSKSKLQQNTKDEDVVENETSTRGDTDSENEKPVEQQEANISSDEGSDIESGEDGEEDDEEDFIGELESDEQPIQKKEWKTLSPEELIVEQQREIQAVADLLAISLTTSAMLLRHFQWRRERLTERYLDNPDKTCKEAGIAAQLLQKTGEITLNRESSAAMKLSGEETCSICSDDVPAEKCTALSCAHIFCNECWGNYLSIKINEGMVTRIKCPDMKCNLAVDEHTVKKLVAPEMFDKFVRFVTKSFVEDSDGRVKWCPQPNCGNAITSDMISGTVVRCKCGYRFCFSCHKDAHAPANCEQVKLWAKKCKDDSETTHWKYANTKDCPKCDTPVEKNGGCNHMTCRQCKHEWCWVCIRPWKGHNDYYNCNKFMKPQKKKTPSLFTRSRKKEKIKEREAARERNRLALETYLHYFERYMNHSHSQELEKQIRNRASSQVNELQKEVSTASELQYILDGTEELLECRNVLKYTYVFAYYLPDSGPNKELFEYLQEDLEKTTEQLSEILEAPATGQVHRLKALNVIQLAKTRKDNLLRAVDQGLTEQQ